MTAEDNSKTIHHLEYEEKQVILLGTAHVSKESAQEVRDLIGEQKPDTVCVELCQSRYQSLRQKERWQETDIVKIIKEKKSFLLLSNLMLASFQKRIARKLDIKPGQEMLQAVLPEVMVNPELRERFYQQFVLRVATLLEQYVQARVELGHIRPVDAPLAARAVQGMFVGLLILRILGDEPLRSGWGDVPDVLATLVFDGLRPREGE